MLSLSCTYFWQQVVHPWFFVKLTQQKSTMFCGHCPFATIQDWWSVATTLLMAIVLGLTLGFLANMILTQVSDVTCSWFDPLSKLQIMYHNEIPIFMAFGATIVDNGSLNWFVLKTSSWLPKSCFATITHFSHPFVLKHQDKWFPSGRSWFTGQLGVDMSHFLKISLCIGILHPQRAINL